MSQQNILGNQSGFVARLRNLGDAFNRLGWVEEALQCYQPALDAVREEEDSREEAAILSGLGSLYAQRREEDTALEHYQQALELFNRLGLSERAEMVKTAILAIKRRQKQLPELIQEAAACLEQQRYAEARRLYEKARKIAIEIGARRDASLCLGDMGWVYYQQGRSHEAIAHYRAALVISAEVGDVNLQVIQQVNLGGAYLGIEEYEKAVECYEEVRAILHSANKDKLTVAIDPARIEQNLSIARSYLEQS